MPSYTYPVLLWKDASDGVTAALVGDFAHTTAHGASQQAALRQLQDFLDWRARYQSWALEPDLVDHRSMEIKVEVRGEYQLEKRAAPTPDSLTLRVTCVVGKSPSGLPVCEVPHLGISFFYSDDQDLAELVRHYVRDALRGHSPAQLALRMPPRNTWFDTITVRERSTNRTVPMEEREDIKLLLQVADPLLRDWARGSAAYERDELVGTVAAKLQQAGTNVLLVGDASIGKSTILLNAARKLSRSGSASPFGEHEDDAARDERRSWRFWRGSGARMIAGMKYLGEWEERCESFVDKLNSIGGVFCVENLLELLRIGGADAGDSVGAFLLPYLQRGELRMAAEATPLELDACRRLLPALVDCFQIVHVQSLTDQCAQAALDQVAAGCAASQRLDIDPGVTLQVLRWFKRFQPYAALPGPAAAFVRKLAQQCRRKPLPAGGAKRAVTMDDAREAFIRQTGLPERLLRDDLVLPPAEIRVELSQSIIGQPDAVEAATRVIAKLKAGLSDPARPLGVLLFCGPTGVGKTALARAIAHFCFGAGAEKDRLVRLDMSEYSSFGAAWRLLHSTGSDAAPWITRVRRQPFSVVLFDEIEKASPEVFDVLLGLLDEGRLTDRFGGITNFRSAIVLMTSNLGATSRSPLGFHSSDAPSGHENAVASFFRPEFFNRLDGVVTFQALTGEHVREIAVKELHDLAQREGLLAHGLSLSWTDALVELLMREGYDRRFGARPLQRELERAVVRPLAQWRLQNHAVRNAKLQVDVVDGTTVVTKL